MKNELIFFSKTIVKYVAIATIAFFITSCNKEDSNELTFSLKCNYNYEDSEYIDVYFVTNGTTIPEVEINGVKIENYDNELPIYGYTDIPFEQTINYSVTANGKTTSGKIEMPEFVSTMECNGTTITENVWDNYISYSSKYAFEWDEAECDHQFFYCSYTTPNTNQLLESDETEFTLKDSDLDYSTYFYVYLTTINGDRLIAGSTPGVTGDYGSGYVTATAESSFSIDFPTTSGSSSNIKSTSINPSENKSKEERMSKLIEEFNNVINKK